MKGYKTILTFMPFNCEISLSSVSCRGECRGTFLQTVKMWWSTNEGPPLPHPSPSTQRDDGMWMRRDGQAMFDTMYD